MQDMKQKDHRPDSSLVEAPAPQPLYIPKLLFQLQPDVQLRCSSWCLTSAMYSKNACAGAVGCRYQRH